jgi:hypothetical protein
VHREVVQLLGREFVEGVGHAPEVTDLTAQSP